MKQSSLRWNCAQLVMVMAPALLAQPGIGPINAAQLLISWPTLADSAPRPPLPCWLGHPRSKRPRVRSSAIGINRGGDRQLNRALHTIVMLRQVHHGPTRAYTSRRIAQGKSQREIRRCLKRTVARQLYRLLERTATTDPWAVG